MQTTWLTVGTACAGLLFAQAPVRAEEPDVQELLKQADAASKALKSFSYEARFFGVGDLADGLPRVKGTLSARRGRPPSLLSRLRGHGEPAHKKYIKATWTRPDTEEESSCEFATDGRTAWIIDPENKTLTEGEMPEAERAAGPAAMLLMIEFLHPTPFQDEIEADEAVHEGEKRVGGVLCDVVYVKYSGGRGESRWYFGREDHLPRRVDRLQGPRGATVLTLANLKPDADLDDGTFTLERPRGFKKRKYVAPARILANRAEPPPLLAAGTAAPDWELKTPDGTTVRLTDLRGQVVVMDFWATWCGPCKAAMPAVQKLHERFKDQAVKVFGVNCWERGDPAKYMKDQKFTYGLLLHADSVAQDYRVSGIPTFYVIGPDGKIVHTEVGFSADGEEKMGKIIEQALKTGDH